MIIDGINPAVRQIGICTEAKRYSPPRWDVSPQIDGKIPIMDVLIKARSGKRHLKPCAEHGIFDDVAGVVRNACKKNGRVVISRGIKRKPRIRIGKMQRLKRSAAGERK